MKIRNPAALKIKVSRNLQAKIRKGFPWVYYYQIQNRNVSGSPGDLGVVYDKDNQFLAIGLYDPYSDIRLRILQTGKSTHIDHSFFRERLRQALPLRQGLEGEGTTGYRVLNGENDGFPGLILDRYGTTGVLKLYTVAWLPHLDPILSLIKEDLKIERCVLLLSKHAERTLPEDAPYQSGAILFGSELDGPVRFLENGLKFEADVLQGQKTGFFLDQRENRQRIRELAENKSVLNVFSYTGGFSIYALAGGCRSVLEIDSNQQVLDAAQGNVRLNFPDPSTLNYSQVRGDAFEQLTELDRQGRVFDLVILDPPAFAKNKKHKKNALLAYTRLAKAGVKRISAGGILFAASCSAPIEAKEFFRAVGLGIKAAGRSYKELMRTRHPLDLPVTFKQGAYLKGIYCEVSG